MRSGGGPPPDNPLASLTGPPSSADMLEATALAYASRNFAWGGSRDAAGTPQRSFILFSGPLDAIDAFGRAGPPWLPPNLWWPDDRAWFVSTDIDLASTYVGGSRVCIDAILSAEEVEALPASVDDPLGVAADTINPSTTSGST